MAHNPMNISAQFGDVEELLEMARRQAQSEFPNLGRVGCPGSAVLKAMAGGGHSPRECVSHVVRCTPCYRQYIESQRVAEVRRRIGLGVAVGLATAAVMLVGLYLGRDRSAPQVAPTPPRQVEVAKIAPQTRVPITVDLAQFAVSRGGNLNRERRPARLPAKRLLVTFQMPLGVEPGIYRIRLTQQSGPVTEEKTVRAQFQKGIAFFELEFDAEDLAGKQVTLSVRPNGLNQREYPLLIEKLPPREGGSTSVEKKE